jgi:excisionase family DNA binding protein
LRIQVPTAYKWLREGTIPAYKVGSTWVILRDELKELVASGHNLPAPQDEPPTDSA